MSKSIDNRKHFCIETWMDESQELHEFLDEHNILDSDKDENGKTYLIPLIDRVLMYGESQKEKQ